MLIEFVAITDKGEIQVEASIVGRGKPHAIIMSLRSGGKLLDLPNVKEQEPLREMALALASKDEYYETAMSKDTKRKEENQP